MEKIKNFTIIFVFFGLVTFPLFIMEEAQQTVMFGTWQAIDSGDWETVYKGQVLGSNINKTMVFVNKWFGWIHPLSYASYNAYGKASDYYWTSLKYKIIKNEPRLFDGEVIKDKSVIPDRFEFKDNKIFAVKANMFFEVPSAEIKEYTVSGSLKVCGNSFYVVPF